MSASKLFRSGRTRFPVETTKAITGAAFNFAAAFADSAVSLTATFAPVPWLSPAVALVGGILELFQNVSTNRHACEQLGGRCKGLLIALKDAGDGALPRKTSRIVSEGVAELRIIKQKVARWAAMTKAQQFFQQEFIAAEIRTCHEMIDSLLTNLQIISNTEQLQWMATFESKREADHKEVITLITERVDRQELAIAAVAAKLEGPAQFKDRIAIMQNGMGNFEDHDPRRSDLASKLYRVTTATVTLLPEFHLRTGEVERQGMHPVGGGQAFDIWEGLYLGQEKCAMKMLRGVQVDPKTTERFLREVAIWRQMWDTDEGKKYILPFYGLCSNYGPYPYLVSPWMEYGHSLDYVKKYPDVDREKIVRRIAEGLRLLHSQTPPIIHGDVKAQNIVINIKGEPLLADFGLSKIMENTTGMPFTQSRGISDSYRWFAPEVSFSPGILSPASDVYAYAMTVLELMTSERPFARIRSTPDVLTSVQAGRRPDRPSDPVAVERGLDDTLWHLLTRCWAADPKGRPTIHEVLESFRLSSSGTALVIDSPS